MKSWHWTGTAFEACGSVPISDRGFRYGMSVFESLRVNAGSGAEFFERHLSRLVQACAEREIAVEEAVLSAAETLLNEAAAALVEDKPGAVGKAAGKAARRSGNAGTSENTASGFARIYVTAGDGGPAAAAEHPRVYVFLESRTPPDPEDPWEIGLSEDSYQPLFGGMKTANYWFNCDVLAQAQRRRLNEMLLFNDRAELVSACMANVFLVHDEKICTPARSSGCRTGVIREWAIARRKVEERRLRREDVVNADEIFLTNSWIGVMPVATVEGRPLGRRIVGPKLAGELARRRVSPE